MKRLLIPVILLLFVLPYATAAQDDEPPSGWPIVERCVTPTVRPDGWTFEGTILLTGYAGIHGVNDAWPTPRVLVFLGNNTVPGGAGLSPDGRWYAELGGEEYFSDIDKEYIVDVQEIRVYSTKNDGEVYNVPWMNSYLHNRDMCQMYWLDNQHLIYESTEFVIFRLGNIFIINPFDGSTSTWDGRIYSVLCSGSPSSLVDMAQYPAPDFTRSLVPGFGSQPTLRTLYTQNGYALAEFNTTRWPYVFWAPDSSHFVIEIDLNPHELWENETGRLVLFDRDGSFVDNIFISENRGIIRTNSAWSDDGHFLTFETRRIGEADRFYIVDLQAHQIVNSCLQIGDGVAFSPDNTQLALLEPGEGTKYVMVLDLESWTLHPVANHIVDWRNSLIGWRED